MRDESITEQTVRDIVVEYLKQHEEFFSNFEPGNWIEYCSRMKRNGEWGDNITWQAAAEVLNLAIRRQHPLALSMFIPESMKLAGDP